MIVNYEITIISTITYISILLKLLKYSSLSLRFAVSFNLSVARIPVEYMASLCMTIIYIGALVYMASSDHAHFPSIFVCTDTILLQCEKQNACVTSFRSADRFLSGRRLPPEEVSARLKFWTRGPLILRLHDKT